MLRRLTDSLWVRRLGGYLIAAGGGRYMESVDFRVAYAHPSVDAGRVEFRQPVLYLIWHEYMTLPFFTRRHGKLAILTSRHRDAEFLSAAAELSGYKAYRGSTGRGGATVLREILSDRDPRSLVITPDGPRGPRRQVAAGAIFLASKLRRPIVLLGGGMDRPFRYRHSWDQFAVARPHSRVRLIMSEPMLLPARIDRERIDALTVELTLALDAITQAAEKWAVSGRPMQGQTAFYPTPDGADSRLELFSE